MKLIIAIIQPSRLEAVKAALTEVEVFRLTIMDVQGFGRQRAIPRSIAATRLPSICCAKCSCRSPSTRNSSSRRSTPSSKAAAPARPAKSATAKSSSCRWTIAFASAPANAAAKRSDRRLYPDTRLPNRERNRSIVRIDFAIDVFRRQLAAVCE